MAEDTTNKRRIDLTVRYGGRCYIFEFKVVEMEGAEPKALEQISSKKILGKIYKFQGDIPDGNRFQC